MTECQWPGGTYKTDPGRRDMQRTSGEDREVDGMGRDWCQLTPMSARTQPYGKFGHVALADLGYRIVWKIGECPMPPDAESAPGMA
eukprot:124307-Rhodomonas_salina.4